MKLSIAVLLLAGAVLVPVASFGQETAGRVLAVAGNVTIERGAERIAAQQGTAVRAGDTFQLGPQSNAQIRFTDASIIALGSDTSFRVSEYTFSGQPPETQRVLLNLIKGGMRTVTGLIGRTHRDNYRLLTPAATIGIRGTELAACHDCVSIRGEPLPGTHLRFGEGSGFIRTQAAQGAELPLAAGQSGFALNANASPVPTLIFPQAQQQASVRPTTTQVAQAAQKESAAAVVAAVTAAAPSAASVAGILAGINVSPTTLADVTPPVFQVTSTPEPVTILSQTSFTGTTFFRLAGSALNIPTTCSHPPCGTVVAGEITLGVNFALQRAQINAALRLNDGQTINVGVPSALSGLPITLAGNQVTFSGTLNRSDFPENSGSFRCSDCGPNHTAGFFEQLTFSGTITANQATVTLGAREADSAGGSLTATLPAATPPSNDVAAMAIQRFDGGTDTRSAAFWGVQLDSSRRLVQFGPNDGVTQFGNRVGGPSASVGTATNIIAGTAPAAGNLAWGTWSGPGAQLTDQTYDSYVSTATGRLSVQPWITGEAPNTLPPSLGTLTFTPVGSVFTNANQRLNSGSLTANFVSRSLTISLNATNMSGGNTYQMNGTTGFNPANSRFSSGFHTVTCTGPCNNGIGTADGSFGGFFAGKEAQGAGVVFSAGFGAAAVTGNAGNGVTGAVGLKR